MKKLYFSRTFLHILYILIFKIPWGIKIRGGGGGKRTENIEGSAEEIQKDQKPKFILSSQFIILKASSFINGDWESLEIAAINPLHIVFLDVSAINNGQEIWRQSAVKGKVGLNWKVLKEEIFNFL